MEMTWEFVLRIFVAALLGGAIGLEREYRAKEAGFRTHFLVALGSALFMIVSAYGFEGAMSTPEHRWDVSRVAAQVDHRRRSLGNRRHRSGLRRWYVYHRSSRHFPGTRRLRGLQLYPSQVRQAPQRLTGRLLVNHEVTQLHPGSIFRVGGLIGTNA